MSTWKLIKNNFTRGKTPKTVGYLQAVRQAALLYAAINHALKDQASSDAVFNADQEVTEVMLLGGTLEQILSES